ncbi:RidA family protein [Actinosynnema sp. NPDC020468]|uniref:RidA family protein n=1 Tax=Actinosynnema sp. NPDC020468 TaxID=3154488 RepID=UPI0033D4D080
MIRRWNPETVAAPAGPYSHLAHVSADHDVVVLAGQVGTLPDGSLAGEDSLSQARAVFANIERLLEAAGAEPAQLVKLFSMVSGTEHLPGYRAAMTETFARWFPHGDFPPQTLIVVAALAAPPLTVEVEALVAIPR